MSVTQKVSLGPHETKLLFSLESEGVDFFDLGTVRRILGLSGNAAAKVAHRLEQKGRIIRVRKGEYLLVPARAGDPGAWSESVFRVVDVLLGHDYYVGFWTALNYWGMTEQVPRVVYAVVPGRRRSFEFQDQRIRFVTLKRTYIFGTVEQRLAQGRFLVSDREKTLLDGLLLPEYCGGVGAVAGGLASARDDLRWRRLVDYERRLGVDTVRRRLGFLLETLDLAPSTVSRLDGPFDGFRWLDPSAPRHRLGYSKRWGLILNLERSELRAAGAF